MVQKRRNLVLITYHLFHCLLRPSSVPVTRSGLASACLSCYLLAGKLEDCPVKMKTLMGLAAGLTPPPPAPGTAAATTRSGPEASLVRIYERSLLSSLAFQIPLDTAVLHPGSLIRVRPEWV